MQSDGMQSDKGGRGGPGRSGGRSPAPVAARVLNDVAIATWLRLPRLHKHTPNFEGMSWKGIVL